MNSPHKPAPRPDSDPNQPRRLPVPNVDQTGASDPGAAESGGTEPNAPKAPPAPRPATPRP